MREWMGRTILLLGVGACGCARAHGTGEVAANGDASTIPDSTAAETGVASHDAGATGHDASLLSDVGASDFDAGITFPSNRAVAFRWTILGSTREVLFVELLEFPGPDCSATAFGSSEFAFQIGDWDGTPGTYVLDAESVHGTAVGLIYRGRHPATAEGEPLSGTLTVEPYDNGSFFLSWDVQTSAGEVRVGRTDLGLCLLSS